MSRDRQHQMSDLYHAALGRAPEERDAFWRSPDATNRPGCTHEVRHAFIHWVRLLDAQWRSDHG